jgi:hypothetical protein
MSYSAQMTIPEYEVTGKRGGKNTTQIQVVNISGSRWIVSTRDESETPKSSQSNMSGLYQTIAQLIMTKNPVQVRKIGEEEHIVYNASQMELNRPYEVVWNGEEFGLMRTNRGVELLKFERDSG